MKERNLDLLSKFNILYLEDEEALLNQTTSVLEDFVCKIYSCKNIEQAKDYIVSKKIDVVISDILLENSTGLELLSWINEKDINIPVILTTAYTDTKYLLEAIRLGAKNYIIKPINIKDLLNILYDVLSSILKDKEIEKKEYIIKTVAAVTDTKAVEMIKFIINNLDDNGVFNHSYSDIMDNIDVSKPTIVKLFKQLSDIGVLVKIQNSRYQFNPEQLNFLEL